MKKTIHFKHSIKRILLFLCIVVVTCIIVKIVYEYSTWIIHKDEMFALAKTTIPGYDYYENHDDFILEEKDAYGRYLFSVDHGSICKNAFIIVQKEDSQNSIVYYYEGDSTLLVDNLHDLSEEEQKQLEDMKKKNDWNKPLDQNKMTALSTQR